MAAMLIGSKVMGREVVVGGRAWSRWQGGMEGRARR